VSIAVLMRELFCQLGAKLAKVEPGDHGKAVRIDLTKVRGDRPLTEMP
jgi:hypothetical protein